MRWRLGTLVSVIALTAGACGGGGSSKPPAASPAGSSATAGRGTAAGEPLRILLAAADRTLAARSSRMAIQVVMTGVTGLPPDGLTMNGDGAFDYASRKGTLAMTIPPVQGVAVGRIDMVLDGTVIYEKLPPELSQQMGSKPWIKIDLQSLARTAGLDPSTFAQAQSGDPTQMLQLLKGADQQVSVVGTEQLRGDTVTHYKATIDMAKAAAAAPAEQQPALTKVADLYGGQPLPVDIWVDGQQRLRKFSQTVDVAKLKLPRQPAGAAAAPPASGAFSLTTELYDFGTAVKAVPPPVDQVTDLGQAVNQGR